MHKTQGRGTHYVGDVGAIKAQGHPAGTGVVIGSYRDYLDKAEEMGADALNVPKSRYDFFNNAGEFETLNRAYLNANAFLNQDFYMSNAPEGVAQSTGYWIELQHLKDLGISPKYAPGVFCKWPQ